jgi:hypothetical protein
MSKPSPRLLPLARAPQALLWNPSTETLRLPSRLTDAYDKVLKQKGLVAMAQSRTARDSPAGGVTEVQTAEYFAKAFESSAARAQLAFLGKTPALNPVSNAITLSTSGRTLTLLDAPCGTCASALSILSCVASLREENILPRIPLDVCLIGADISTRAQEYSALMLSLLNDWYASQGLFITPQWVIWDATNRSSNIKLLEALHASPAPRNTLILTANFSRVLKDAGKYESAMPQFKDLWESAATARTRQGVVVWIEPQMNDVTAKGGVFTRLYNTAKKLPIIEQLLSPAQEQLDQPLGADPYATDFAQMTFLHGSASGTTRLAVMKFDIKRTQ